MKLNNTVLTLALVGVLALAALAGGLLPAGNAVHAQENCDPATIGGELRAILPQRSQYYSDCG